MRLARTADPCTAYAKLYRAKVLRQSTDLETLDVQPEADILPIMTGIPLRTGIPGVSAQVSAGSHVLVGWADGDPTKPFAAIWDTDPKAVRVIVTSDRVDLGGSDAGEALVMGTTFMEAQDVFLSALMIFTTALGESLPAMSTPAETMNTATLAFKEGVATYLSTISRTK